MAKLSSQKAQDYGYLRAEKNKSKKGKSLASILEERKREKKKNTPMFAPINTHAK